MSGRTILASLVLMAVVTYLPRVLPLAIFRKRITNPFVQSFLLYMPFAILAAMVFPEAFSATSSLISAAAGVAVALLLAWREKGLLIVALGATAAVFGGEWLMRAMGF